MRFSQRLYSSLKSNLHRASPLFLSSIYSDERNNLFTCQTRLIYRLIIFTNEERRLYVSCSSKNRQSLRS